MALVAASAVWIAIPVVFLVACKAGTAAAGIPRQAGKLPISTLLLPGPPVNTGGKGWATLSVILAAGLDINN